VTVKLVPHAGRRTVSLRFTFGGLLFFGVLTALILSAGAFILRANATAGHNIQSTESEITDAQANLNSVIEEVDQLSKVANILEGSLSGTIQELSTSPGGAAADASNVSLHSFANRDLSPDQRAVSELKQLSETLRTSVRPLSEIEQVVALQRQLLDNIPNKWPVIAGRGRVTLEFGPAIHPITDQWYLHKGFDIADTPGVPIVASASGKVVMVEYDKFNYGWNVIIQHKYGFKTRYAHMREVVVKEGQMVHSGQQLGTLGASGIVTGPHLHFEIMLGNDVLDPAAFLKISNDFVRWRGNRKY